MALMALPMRSPGMVTLSPTCRPLNSFTALASRVTQPLTVMPPMV